MRVAVPFALLLAGCQTLPVETEPLTVVPLTTYHGRLDAAGTITFPPDRDHALALIAAESAARGEASDPAVLLAVVQQALGGMNFPPDHDFASRRAATALARRGMTAEATTVAKAMTFPPDRDGVLAGLATGEIGQ